MVKQDHNLLRHLLSLLILFILPGLVSCSLLSRATPTPTPVPLSIWITKWLMQPSCKPPCWEGIIPGVTTITDTLKIVGNMPGIMYLKGPLLSFPNSNQKEVDWHFVNTFNEGGRAISNNAGVIQSILLGIGPNKSLTVGDVVSAYGPPSNVVFSDCRGGMGCVMHLVYLSSGMVLQFFVQNANVSGTIFKVEMNPDFKVEGIWFFPPGLDGYRSSVYPPIDTLDELMNWNGYSTYTRDLSVH
jgi:hypothetical protein